MNNIQKCLIIMAVAVAFLAMAGTSHALAADEIHWSPTGQQSVTFDWRGTSAENVINYGLTALYGQTAIAQPPVPYPISCPTCFYWEAKLEGLQENTLYHYSIGGGPDHTFRTPPPRGASGFTVAVEGDLGSSAKEPNMPIVQSQIANSSPAFVLVVGDITYANQYTQAVVDQHFNDVMVWSQDAAYIPAWGNHEWISPSLDDLRNYKGRFDFAHPQTSTGSPAVSCCGEDWDWFDYGNVRFISYPEPWTSGTWREWNATATMLMDNAQADPNINFIVTYGHRPAYSSGWQSGDSSLKSRLNTLACNHGKYVLNLNGHAHDYERSYPQKGSTCTTGAPGVIHITAGTGGKDLRQSGSCLWPSCTPPSWSAFRAMHLGPVKLTFTTSTIYGQFICGPAGGGTNDVSCVKGDIIDSFSAGSSILTDTIPPTDPTNLKATTISSAQIDLAWSPSKDNVGVAGYKVYRDLIQIATTTAAAYSDIGLTPSTTYTYAVAAYDAAGNLSRPSVPASSTTLATGTTVLTFAPTADASIKLSYPTTNFGTSTILEADNSPVEQFLMKFTISGVGTQKVASAKLRLYNVNASDKGGNFYRVADNSWIESAVAWNTAPAADALPLATLGPVSVNTWYEVDITPLITGDGVFGLRVTSLSSDGADYTSKEGKVGFYPQLIVTIQ